MLEMLPRELSEASSGESGSEEAGVPVERSSCRFTFWTWPMKETSCVGVAILTSYARWKSTV